MLVWIRAATPTSLRNDNSVSAHSSIRGVPILLVVDTPLWATSPHSQIPSVGCLYFHWRGGLELGPMGQLSHWFWWPWVGAIAIFPALLQTPLNTLTPLIPLHFSMFWPSGERLVYPQLTLCFCGLRYISFPEGRYLFAWVTNHDTNDSRYVTTWGN